MLGITALRPVPIKWIACRPRMTGAQPSDLGGRRIPDAHHAGQANNPWHSVHETPDMFAESLSDEPPVGAFPQDQIFTSTSSPAMKWARFSALTT